MDIQNYYETSGVSHSAIKAYIMLTSYEPRSYSGSMKTLCVLQQKICKRFLSHNHSKTHEI